MPAIRLRLHVLLFNHLQLCKELFSKPLFLSQRRAAQAMRQTSLSADELKKEIRRLLGNPSKITKDMVSKAGFTGTFQKLSILDLEKWFLQLREKTTATLNSLLQSLNLDISSSAPLSTSSSNANSFSGKRKRANDDEPKSGMMNLYLHNLVAHIPDFFECMDFKNSSTERFEGFLAFSKKTLNDSTNRNPSHEQAAQEVFIRHHFRGVGTCYKGKYYHPLYSKIAKHFSEFHSMHEVFVLQTGDNDSEVAALMRTLVDKGYTQFSVLQDGRILFHTVEEAEEVFSGLTPELDALRVRADESESESESESEDEEDLFWSDPDDYDDLPAQ